MVDSSGGDFDVDRDADEGADFTWDVGSSPSGGREKRTRWVVVLGCSVILGFDISGSGCLVKMRGDRLS